MNRLRMFTVFSVCAIALLTCGCSKDPKALQQQHFAKGDEYLRNQKYNEAIIEYRKAIQVDFASGEAHRKLAVAYLESGDASNAYRQYMRAADMLPEDVDVQLTAGGLRLVAGEFEDAKTTADRMLARDPKNVRALTLRANAIAGLKDMDNAVEDIEEAISLNPRGSELFTNLGMLERKRERLKEAEDAFTQAIAIDPRSARAHSALGNFYWSTNRIPEAEKAFTRAVELDPNDLIGNRALALFYLTTRRRDQAEKPLRVLADTAKDMRSRMTLADYYLLGNRVDEGVKVLQQALIERPGFLPAKTRLAAIAYSSGRRDEAHKAVDELLAKDPNNPEALLLQARFLLAEGKMEPALARARAATVADPKLVRGFFLVGQISAAMRNFEEAEKAYAQVVRMNPRAAAAQVELSRLHLASGNANSSVQYAQQAVLSAPASTEAHLALARSLVAHGDVSRAEVELRALDKAHPDAAAVQALLGDIHVAKKDYSSAKDLYERAYRRDPSSVDALSGLIALDLVASKPAAARARLETHLAGNAQSVPALLLAAKTYGATHDLRQAEMMLRRAIETDPSSLDAYGMLGQLYYAQGRLDAGRTEFENLLTRQPNSVAANTMLAIILDQQGRRAEAKARYEKILGVDRRAVVAANNLAWIYAERGEKLDRALELAQSAAAQVPDEPVIIDTLGWVYYKKALPNLAVPLLQQAVDKDPKNPQYLYHLGVVEAANAHHRAARRALERALQLSPSFPDADAARKLLATLR